MPLSPTAYPWNHTHKHDEKKKVTREKVVVVSGTDEERREVLLAHLSADALEGGRLGFPGAPAFDAGRYLGDGNGNGGDGVTSVS